MVSETAVSSEDASVTDLCVQTVFGYTKEEYIKFLFLNVIFQQPSRLLTFLKKQTGLDGQAPDLLAPYLTGHAQCVSVNGVQSELSERIWWVYPKALC